jgi:hypothetical protein
MSRWFREAKYFSSGTPERGDGPHHVARLLGCMVGPRFHLMKFSVDFFFSRACISKENDMAKDWFCLTSGRSLKVKNMQKK